MIDENTPPKETNAAKQETEVALDGATCSSWVLCQECLPPPNEEVLTWDKKRDLQKGYWVDRGDLPKGRYWSISGQSGGIGTPHEIRPPTHWMPRPASPNSEAQPVHRICVYRDDTIPAFGGWCAGSMKEGEPTILLNVAACLLPCVDENGDDVPYTIEEKKWLIISTLMHEFGHALQEFFDLEFTEERIEELASEYERHYLTNAERIHGGAGLPNQPETPTPLDGASC